MNQNQFDIDFKQLFLESFGQMTIINENDIKIIDKYGIPYWIPNDFCNEKGEISLETLELFTKIIKESESNTNTNRNIYYEKYRFNPTNIKRIVFNDL